jgi:hypothetical protein
MFAARRQFRFPAEVETSWTRSGKRLQKRIALNTSETQKSFIVRLKLGAWGHRNRRIRETGK